MKAVPIITACIIVILFAFGGYISGNMPAQMASHWDAQGTANGFSSRAFGMFFIPVLALVLFLILYFVPYLDPLRKNIEGFREYYDGFLLVFVAFLSYLYVLTLLWNAGVAFNMVQWLSPGFAVIFFYAGILLMHAKRNWTIGIRTPWTISDDGVWDRTHRLGGKLFRAAGVLCLGGVLFPSYAILFVVVPIIIVAIGVVVFSYVEYRKVGEKKRR